MISNTITSELRFLVQMLAELQSGYPAVVTEVTIKNCGGNNLVLNSATLAVARTEEAESPVRA